MVKLATLRSCGDSIWPLLKVTKLRGGGMAYDYGIYTQDIPPSGFNVLKASDKQLAEYGLPTHKQLGLQWNSVMGNAIHSAPAPRYLVGIATSGAGADAPASGCPLDSCSSSWSGHVVEGHTYNEVSAGWQEPSFYTVSGCSGGQFSQWVGLGGFTANTTGLAQLGTAFNEPGMAAHQGWIETIIGGSGSEVAIDVVASKGDSMWASATWDPANSWYDYYMQDTGSDPAQYYSGHSREDDSPDNSTAEVIEERPNYSFTNDTPNLSPFNNFSVTGATSYWGSSSAGFVNNPDHYQIKMQDPASLDTLADPTPLNSNSNFTAEWDNCD